MDSLRPWNCALGRIISPSSIYAPVANRTRSSKEDLCCRQLVAGLAMGV